MNIDDAIDDYNSKFDLDLGINLFAGDVDVFIYLSTIAINTGKKIEAKKLREFFPPLKRGAVY